VNGHDDRESREQLLLVGGAAFMALGATMLMSHPGVRRGVLAAVAPLMHRLQEPLAEGIGALLPEVRRYFKIQSM